MQPPFNGPHCPHCHAPAERLDGSSGEHSSYCPTWNHPAPGTSMWYERKIKELEKKLETYQLVESYIKDLIEMWPTVTFRTIYKVTNKISELKEALALTNK